MQNELYKEHVYPAGWNINNKFNDEIAYRTKRRYSPNKRWLKSNIYITLSEHAHFPNKATCVDEYEKAIKWQTNK